MPGLLKKDDSLEIAGAIAYPVEQNHGTRENVPEQRQPTSLQGLLRFAVETTRNEDTPGPSVLGPMDEERRKFLEDALKSMTIDIIELLLKQIKVFDDIRTVSADSDVMVYTQALETILDYVDHIDIANDFHKIGGFTIFDPCLKCAHPKVRAGACEVLAELCQNNPYCQKVATDNCFILLLLRILDEDEDDVCVKALYALSAIVRDNEPGLREFSRNAGLDVILKTIKKKDDKLRTKSAFFLCAISQSHEDYKDRLMYFGYLPVLMEILSEEHMPSHEHILSLLKCVAENEVVKNVCTDPQYNLQSILKNNLDITKDKEECFEEHEHCRHLLNHLFPGWNN